MKAPREKIGPGQDKAAANELAEITALLSFSYYLKGFSSISARTDGLFRTKVFLDR